MNGNGEAGFHLSAYFDFTAAAIAQARLAGVDDGYLTLSSSGNFIYPENVKLLGAVGYSDTITRAALSAPHWREVCTPELAPVITETDSLNATLFPYWEEPFLTIPAVDEISFLATTSGTAGPGTYGFVWAGKGLKNMPTGRNIFPCRWTATVPAGAAGTAGWVRTTVTLQDTLPAGRYAIVGQDVLGSVVDAVRIRFQKYTTLPGSLVRKTLAGAAREEFRYGRMGNWGEFEQIAQPTIETISGTGAGGTITGIWDLVQVRAGNISP